PATFPLDVEDVTAQPPLPLSLEEALGQAILARPEIGVARQSVAEALHGEQAAHGELLPRVYVRGAVIRADSPGELRGWVAGAGLAGEHPLYGGGRHLAELRRSRARAAAAYAALRSILDNITQQVSVAYQALTTSQERIRLGQTEVTQARENLRLTLQKYKD